MATSLEDQKVKLYAAIETCEKGKRDLLQNSQQTKASLQKQLNDYIVQLSSVNETLNKKTSVLAETRIANEKKVHALQEELGRRETQIQLLTNQTLAQSKVVEKSQELQNRLNDANEKMIKLAADLEMAEINTREVKKQSAQDLAQARAKLQEKMEMEKTKLMDRHSMKVNRHSREVAELNAKLEVARSVSDGKLKEINRLRADFEAKIKTIGDLQNELSSDKAKTMEKEDVLHARIEELDMELILTSNKLTKLQKEHDNLSLERIGLKEKMENKSKVSSKRISELQTNLRALDSKCVADMGHQQAACENRLQTQEAAGKAKVESLRQQIRDMKSRMDKMKNEYTANQKKMTYSARRKEAELNKKVARYRVDLQKSYGKISKMDKDVKTLETEKEGLGKKIADIEAKLEETRNSYAMCDSRYQDSVRAYNNELKSLRTRLDVANQTLKKKDSELAQKAARINEMHTRVESVTSDLKSKTDDLDQCRKNRASCHSNVQKITGDIRSLNDRLLSSKSSIHELNSRLSSCGLKVSNTKERLANSTREFAAVSKKLEESEKTVFQLQRDVQDLRAELIDSRARSTDAKNRNAQLIKLQEDLEARVGRCSDSKSQLAQKHSEMKTTNAQLDATITNLKKEVNMLNQQIESARRECKAASASEQVSCTARIKKLERSRDKDKQRAIQLEKEHMKRTQQLEEDRTAHDAQVRASLNELSENIAEFHVTDENDASTKKLRQTERRILELLKRY
jgi:chromosome segregation ATPase